jgi:hypothetical protein
MREPVKAQFEVLDERFRRIGGDDTLECWDGKRLNSPNDIVERADGSTGPTGWRSPRTSAGSTS